MTPEPADANLSRDNRSMPPPPGLAACTPPPPPHFELLQGLTGRSPTKSPKVSKGSPPNPNPSPVVRSTFYGQLVDDATTPSPGGALSYT